MSHGGRGRDYEPDERFSRGRGDYGDERRGWGSDSGRGRESYGEERGFNRGFSGMDSEPRREFSSRDSSTGREWRGDYRDYDERDGRYARDRSDQDYDEDRRGGSGRGFASMDPERRREIAARGGRASHGDYGRREEGYPSRGREGYEGRGQDYREEDHRWSGGRSDYDDNYEDENYSSRRQGNESDDFDYEA
ncbi:MAG TPA: KGG domain-containing protein, partial [Luteolibacter sp.]